MHGMRRGRRSSWESLRWVLSSFPPSLRPQAENTQRKNGRYRIMCVLNAKGSNGERARQLCEREGEKEMTANVEYIFWLTTKEPIVLLVSLARSPVQKRDPLVFHLLSL